MNTEKLDSHIFKSYVNLRTGIAILAIAFPPLLFAIGKMHGVGLQDSMSAYYHAVQKSNSDYVISTRDVFVGILFAIGVFLVLYKGFTSKENWVLNAAGTLAVGIALFPMEWDCGADCRKISIHGFCAITFFLSIAYVCIYRASDSLRYINNDPIRMQRYRLIYKLFGFGMIASPFIALLLTLVFLRYKSYTFFAEAAGIWTFAFYWIVKSRELSKTHIESILVKEEIETKEKDV